MEAVTESSLPVPKASTKTSKVKKQMTHPKMAEMVCAAISHLKQARGSSVKAIKGYIIGNYQCADDGRTTHYIKKFIQKALNTGELVQMPGQKEARFRLDKRKIKANEKMLKKDHKKSVIQRGGIKTVKRAASKKSTARKPSKLSAKKSGSKKILKKSQSKSLRSMKTKVNKFTPRLKKAGDKLDKVRRSPVTLKNN